MTAIYKRELKSYFHSFVGCLFIGATLFLIGIYVTVYNLYMGYPDIALPLSSVVILFLISLPVLTMRTLAEERKQRTDQLILTAPVSVGRVVLGKYLAMATIFAIPTAVTCLYVPALRLFGTVPLAESYTAILGFLLYGLAGIAVCTFVSSLTESQVIAAVLSFAALFVGYIMSGLCNMISAAGNWLTRILGAFDMISRFDGLLNGMLDLRSVIYYLTLIAVFLFLATQSIQKRRYSVSVRNLRMGAYSSVTIVVVLAACVLVNLLVGELPSRYTSLDVTSSGLYTLGGETERVVRGLTGDVDIYVLQNEQNQDPTVQKTLEGYEDLSEHIRVSYVDPAVNPKFYTKYTDAPVSAGSLIVSGAKRSRVVEAESLYETEIDYTTFSSNVTGYDGEGQITSALAYVTSEDMPEIYIVDGHGELAFEADFLSAIEKENVEYQTVNLMQLDAIPQEVRCVVINAPTSDFSNDDARKVLNYLKAGGKALIVSTWTEQDMSNFRSILDYYGVSVGDGLVLEGDSKHYYQDPFYLLPTVEPDTITDSALNSGNYVFAPYAQGMTLPEGETDTMVYTPLLTTSEDSYLRTDLESVQDYSAKEGDVKGPFTLGVKVVKTEGDKESAAVIYSCENLFTDNANLTVSGTNRKLFTGTLGSLVEHTDSVSVPVKSYESSRLMIPQQGIAFLSVLTVIVLPFGILITGFVIWFRRRKK